MGRKRSFLGFLATLAMLFVGANAFAAAYTCPETVRYTSCVADRYLSAKADGNDCLLCPGNSTSPADNALLGCNCNTGYSVDGTVGGATTGATSDCLPILTYVTLDQTGATTTGAPLILYAKYGATSLYSNTARTTTISKLTVLPQKKYTVTYNANGGSVSTTSATSNCPFAGYGTYINADGTITTAGINAANSHYTQEAYSWGISWGTCGALTLPTPTRTGYEFNGWYTAASGGTLVGAAGASYTPSANTILYAQWTANCNAITVDYKTNGGDTGSTTLYKLTGATTWSHYSDCYPLSTNALGATKDHGIFKGYYTAPSGGTKVSGGLLDDDPNVDLSTTWTVTGPTTIYAQFECESYYHDSGTVCAPNEYTITLSGNGATSNGTTALYTTYDTNVYLDSPRSKAMTTAANAVTEPTRTGYNFTGYWSAISGGIKYIDSNGYITSNGLTVGKNATADTTWYAQWTPIDSRFTFVASQATSATNAAAYVYTRYDSGAFLDSDRTQAMSTSANPIYVPSREYTVTYDANGGSVYDANGDLVSEPSDTARYTFNGYWTATSGGTQYFAAEVLPSGAGKSYITEAGIAAAKKNTTITELYAQWKESRVTLPTPKRNGYVFKGWYTKGGEEVGDADKTYAPTSNVTLYAQWTVDTYTISFDLNGGSGSTPSSVTQPYGSEMQPYEDLDVVPYKTGYTFMGWYDNKTYTSGTKYYNADGTSANEWDKTDDATLYAGWEANTFTVLYAGNGNTGGSAPTSPTSCTYGSTCAAPSNAYTKTNYVFVGWACTGGTTSCDGDIIQPGASLSTVSTGSTITLTAQWVREYTKFAIDNAGGSSNVSEIYLKYDPSSKTFSWVDSTKSTAITKIAIPTRAGYTFTGYTYNPCQYRDTACALSICFGFSSACSVDITKTDLTTLKSVSGVSNENYFYFTTDLANESETWTMSANWTQCTGLLTNAEWTTSTNNTCAWNCKACVKGTNAASCSVSKGTNSCTYSGTCNVDTYNPTVSGVTVSCSDCPTGSNAEAGNVATSCEWNKYSVTYSCGAGDGTEPAGATATYNSNFTPAANTCSRDGYNFSGWSVSGTSDVKAAGTAFPWAYVEDKTFTAVWVLQGNKAVTYETNGGTINDTSVVSSCNVETATFNLPTNVTKTGYTFAGWYESSDFSGSAVTSVAKGTCLSDLKFYAKWDANAITVVYDGDGQTSGSVANQTCYYDQDCIVQGQGNLLKTNYVFSHWTYNSTLYEVGTNIKNIITGGTVTLTATWKLEYTRIDLGDNGGSGGSGTIYLKYNLTGGLYNGPRVTLTDSNKADITSVKIPIRKGYVFAGYQYDDCEFLSDTDCFLKHGSSEYWKDFIKADGTLLYPDDIIGYQGITGYRTAKAKWTQCTGLPTNADWTISTNNTCTWACGSEFYQSSGTCVTCPTNADCDGTSDWDCWAGYEKNAAGTACQGKEYTVTLDADGGMFGSDSTATVTATYNQVLPDATMPTRTNYNFMGIYSAKNGGGDQYYDASGTPTKLWTTDGGATLYAHWLLGVFPCEEGKAADGTTCSAGSYCPGGNVTAGTETGANGCERTCPADAAGGTVSSVAGAKKITQCYTSRAVDIYDSTITTITGKGTETRSWSESAGAYDANPNIVPTSCFGGYYRSSNNSPYCIPVGYGYYRSVNDAIGDRSACSALNDADPTVVMTGTETAKAATECYNTCSNIAIANGVRKPVNSKEYYNDNDEAIPACSYTTSCSTGYSPSDDVCQADIYTVTLEHNNGTSEKTTIYLKYGSGWCEDVACSKPITSVDKPTYAGKTFGGYKTGNTVIATSEGVLNTNYTAVTANITAQASWDANPLVSCLAGTYYPGTGTECLTCEADYFCKYGLYTMGTGDVGGLVSCDSLNGTYTAAKDANDTALTVVVSSPIGSKAPSDCYATNVEYVPDQYTAGSQTCKYDEATNSYTAACYDEKVYTCDGGYALATTDAIECTPVGYGKYSPDKVLTATTCPVNPDTGTIGTTQQPTSNAVGQCIMDNLWFENDTSGQRRQCFYSSTSGLYDTNCPQSTIVTCIAGYWYDATQSQTDCVPVGNGYYSPAQTECTGEVEQPTAAGCSTKRSSCPNGTLTGKEDAASILECENVCPAGSFCIGGVTYSCEEETGDYKLSAPGSDDITDCYYEKEDCACSQDCPDKEISVNSCVISKAVTFAGVVYYPGTSDECVLLSSGIAQSCPYKQVKCNDSYYLDGEFDGTYIKDGWSCKLCSSLGDGEYTQSRASGGRFPTNIENGPGACFKSVNLYCTEPVCPLEDRQVYCSYDTSAYKELSGWLFYDNDIVYPAVNQTHFVCPATGVDGSYFDCKEGYDKNEDADIDPTDGTASDPSELCTPHVYTITLSANYDGGVDYKIYQKFNDGFYVDDKATQKLTQVARPKREGWTFNGYYTSPTALSMYQQLIDAEGYFRNGVTPDYTEDMTLYAWWTQETVDCIAGKYFLNGVETDCEEGQYCPGSGKVPIGQTGCMVDCPEDGWTIESGQSSVTSCHKTFYEGDIVDGEEKDLENGVATWDCTWEGDLDNGGYSRCTIKISECDAGYYNPATSLNCKVAGSGYYSPAKVLTREACPAKTNYVVASNEVSDKITDCYVNCDSYTPTVQNSTSVGVEYKKSYYSTSTAGYLACSYNVVCKTGYTAISGTAPQCKANEYTITLNKNKGSGNIADTVRCTFDSGSCTLPATSVLTRAGYVTANKWCTNDDGTGTCYEAGKSTSQNISYDGTDGVTLYAIWTPSVFKITLSAPDAEVNADQGPVYLKYETGWYSDAAATKPLKTLGTNLPEKGNGAYTFSGYTVGSILIIGNDGALLQGDAALTATTTDTTAFVVWGLGDTVCEPGYYYPGTGSQCMVCTENHYCPGGEFGTDSNTVGGLFSCRNGGLSAGGVSATSDTMCYKNGLPYVTYLDEDHTQPRAQGTWTCYYDTVGYTNCVEDTIEIAWCAAGYWYNSSANPIDCVVAGENNFSPVADLKAYVCPDSGNTAGVETSDELGDCMKRMATYESYTGNAKGTHVCSARLDGDTVKYDQNCQAATIEVTWCTGGYWFDNTVSEVDCVAVGKDRYSPDGELVRYECPHGGTTESTTTVTAHGECQKVMVYPGVDYTGPAVHGSGIRGCYYDSASDGKSFGDGISDGYLLNCGDITMTKCDKGYYWNDRADTVCKMVDYGHYGPVVDENNSGNMTARAACPNNGMTKTATSASADACYLTDVACDVANGSGEHTCNYDASAGAYAANCTACVVTGCDTGYSQVGDECINCPEDSVCVGGEQQTCAELTGGTHTKSDAGTNDVAYCYKECDVIANVAQMSGRDYYGANVADTCEIKVCAAGYTLADGKCVECPEGYVCDPNDPDNPGKPKSCSVLTGGTHTMSDAGAKSVKDCYQQCEPYEVVNGTAVPVEEKAYYPAECDYEGRSDTGNPCEIVDGVCIETSCNYNFELINGVCKPCARENAITYKQNGNCVVESCASGFHPNGQACESDVTGCVAPNALAATQVWNPSKNAFGECIITKCDAGYHLAANACQVDEQVCELEHGIGLQEWNHDTNTWGECIATECDPGYTNDRSQTNELWKQCGRCNNMYSADGDLAASSYVQECEIAACMYQGEKYILENNECRLICNEFEDETGRRYWDNNKKKCIHDCNEEKGYVPW